VCHLNRKYFYVNNEAGWEDNIGMELNRNGAGMCGLDASGAG